MKIDLKKCVGCGNCVPYCPMGAIRIENGLATVNEDECVECNTCFRCCESAERLPFLVSTVRNLLQRLSLRFIARMDICPTGALVPPELAWPRSLRRAFSDPTVTHDSTGVAGRGTEEIKTNDVTGRIGPGEAGVVIDLGRPGTGVFLYEINEMTRALARLDINFEKQNPLSAIMQSLDTGELQEDTLQEKVLSAIIELKIELDQLAEVLETVEKVSRQLDTVISVGVSGRCLENGSIPYEQICRTAGYSLSLNGKTNLGLGHAKVQEESI